MDNRLQVGAVTLALLGSVALAATAVAQTGSPAPGGATNSQAPGAMQNPFNLTPDGIKSFLSGLAGLATQSAPSGFKPSVGTPVPQNMQLNPIPSDAKASVPQANQDHHVAKLDDDNDNDADVILIVDPITRQIVGMVSADDGSTTGLGTPLPGAPSSPNAPSGSSK